MVVVDDTRGEGGSAIMFGWGLDSSGVGLRLGVEDHIKRFKLSCGVLL